MVRRGRGCWCGRDRKACGRVRVGVAGGMGSFLGSLAATLPCGGLGHGFRPSGPGVASVASVRGWVARWWFENWIVDASGHGPGARGCCMILSRHASPVLWGVCVDRLVTDHFCCVLVWSSWCLQLAFSGGRAVAGEGVWWMPWQTVPMKDVVGRDRPRGAAERALIRGFPNGVTRRP